MTLVCVISMKVLCMEDISHETFGGCDKSDCLFLLNLMGQNKGPIHVL